MQDVNNILGSPSSVNGNQARFGDMALATYLLKQVKILSKQDLGGNHQN